MPSKVAGKMPVWFSEGFRLSSYNTTKGKQYIQAIPVPSKVAGKMTVWKGTLSLPMNCTLLLLRTHSAKPQKASSTLSTCAQQGSREADSVVFRVLGFQAAIQQRASRPYLCLAR